MFVFSTLPMVTWVLNFEALSSNRSCKQLDVVVHDLAVETPVLDGVGHGLQQPVRIVRADRYARDANHRALPGVVRIHFSGRDVELMPQPREKRLQDAALALQGTVSW